MAAILEGFGMLPEQTELAFRADNGYTEFTLPEITGYQMFCLEK